MVARRPVSPWWPAGPAGGVIVMLLIAGARFEGAFGAGDQVPATVSPLRINEVMAQPVPMARNGAGEWVELINQGAVAIDLSGWSLGDDADPDDRLLPWHPGTPLWLPAGGLALVIDPDTDLESLALPPGVLLLRPDDASIGNGLRIDGDRLWLTDPAGVRVDSMRWQSRSGAEISWERTGGWGADAEQWRPSRDPEGATPGRPNSWTPLPGDYRLRWIAPEPIPLPADALLPLRGVLLDRGGSGVGALQVQGRLIDPQGIERELDPLFLPGLAPRDSVTVVWSWRPDQGGRWRARVWGEGAEEPRGWDRADTMVVPVRHRARERVLSEALPRPLAGEPEWLEFWSPVGKREWEGWQVRVRSLGGGAGSARNLTLPAGRAGVVLVAYDSVAVSLPPGSEVAAPLLVIWRGLRLADAGCSVMLIDPEGTVVDSAVLRPFERLPPGHSYQRWRPDLPGWLPAAWGFSRTPQECTPGWVEEGPSGGDSADPADPNNPPEQKAPGSPGLAVRIDHIGPGRVALEWRSPLDRLWLEARLYTLAGSQAGVPVPRALVPGAGRLEWDRRTATPGVAAGLYLLVIEAREPGGSGHWVVRRALGVRP